MATNPMTIRFQIGHTYRLRTAPDFPRYYGGSMTVTTEIKPTDKWGNRIILADFSLTDNFGNPIPDGIRLGARCFVEEGIMELNDPYGVRPLPVEIAALQGCYPMFGKVYAVDEVRAVAAAVA